MKSKFKLSVLILTMAVMTIFLAACSIETTPTIDAEATPTIDKTVDVVSVDETVKTNNEWKMTYKGCQIKNKLDVFTEAEEGTEFVVAFFEIENISDESQNFSIFMEEFYIDDIKTAQTVYGMSIDKAFQLTAIPVEPGRKAMGYFLFQTSPDWEKLEIIYHEGLIDENEENVIKFTLTKNVDKA